MIGLSGLLLDFTFVCLSLFDSLTCANFSSGKFSFLGRSLNFMFSSYYFKEIIEYISYKYQRLMKKRHYNACEVYYIGICILLFNFFQK